MNHLGDYDVIVIGAGHAGIEAAHAAATLGAKTAVFTMSLDAIGNMPCNPSIGGTAKGTLVRELDALGGVMGLAADATYLQSRMLNKGKGPAVHALRVQTDRKRYHEYMKHALELTPGLAIHQAEVVGIEVENGHVKGVVTQLNGEYSAKCVVIATGTNLGGKIFVGDAWYASGPDGMHAANALTESLKAAGLPLRRFKTGTPARVHRRSIDFSKLECQPGDPDSELQPFSFLTDAPMHNKVECWIAYTNPETHRIILDNIQRSPLYGGMIEGVGPRYCPSIEDKVVRFAGKDRHPIFVEPCGENTEEMYLQGASSSLPEDVQNAFYRSIQGFEHIEIMRPAYAIEYDCVDPTSLEATLESKVVRGLYGAGQFNGTSGYEEAAAQGLLAGLNAARSAKGESQLILERQTSYLGTLVDDLVTKGVMDPYRMMTSRSEYRLTLRQDNADQRLTPIGREYGLVQDDRWAKYQHTQSILEAERRRLHETHLRTADLRAAMEAAGLTPAAEGGIAEELLRRPEISYPLLAGVIGWGEGITPMLAERLETEIKYAGYIARQDRMIRDVARHEKTLIPADFEYADLTGLTLDAALSIVILGVIMWGIIPGVIIVAGWFELLFVNGFGMPFNTGVVIYALLLIAGLTFGIRYTLKHNHTVVNTILTCFVVMLIGYSCYAMVVIRSVSNPPIDENSPDNVFSLLSYISRDQYGQEPLVYGPYFNAPVIGVEDAGPVYYQNEKTGKYDIMDNKKEVKYDPRFCTILPRMYSQAREPQVYYEWVGQPKGPVYMVDGQPVQKPSFGQNLSFMFR